MRGEGLVADVRRTGPENGVLLAVEIVEEGSRRHLGPFADRVDRYLVHAVAQRQSDCRLLSRCRVCARLRSRRPITSVVMSQCLQSSQICASASFGATGTMGRKKGGTVTATRRPDRWLRAAQLWWPTRAARKSGDIGSLIRVLAARADRAVGIRVRGRFVVLLVDPSASVNCWSSMRPPRRRGRAVRLTRLFLGDGLLDVQGATHHRARRLIAPAFSPRRLVGYTAGFTDRTRALTARWREGQTMDAHDEMAALTLDIVGSTLLGIDLSSRTSTIRTSLNRHWIVCRCRWWCLLLAAAKNRHAG